MVPYQDMGKAEEWGGRPAAMDRAIVLALAPRGGRVWEGGCGDHVLAGPGLPPPGAEVLALPFEISDVELPAGW
eukprot:CAMPEP_0194771614 /NCGR_PEP_ID=MMETSP0323_2-20130528/49688_1 /TAXON_ID=2866 ORGANISM="Crypthecodinium cohnii, Strain Seligo" /NCGR_SAMPLE_ID=MMETSP0323_2 /ASSEMBLY_ACC=CAM_ASM_000346 /LENGTH=73 /DNA_ID=CAMNT_0039705791 /DNA_START=91 /DNA_END=312 /DNA_ORIENTATION=-